MFDGGPLGRFDRVVQSLATPSENDNVCDGFTTGRMERVHRGSSTTMAHAAASDRGEPNLRDAAHCSNDCEGHKS